MSAVEELTTNFYLWETRGRGWQVWDLPVFPEPAFVPCFHRFYKTTIVDDARKPTTLSVFGDRIKQMFTPQIPAAESSPTEEVEDESEPEVFECPYEIKAFRVILPTDFKVAQQAAEHFLLNLTFSSWPVCFEVIGTGKDLVIQFACREPDVMNTKQQLMGHFPGISIREEASLQPINGDGQGKMVAIDLGLRDEFMRPLQTFSSFEQDPLTGFYSVLDNLSPQEVGMLQVICQSTRQPWVESILRSVTDSQGGPFFSDAPEILPLAKEKVSRPLFAVVVRVMARGSDESRSWEIVKNLVGSLSTLTRPESNALIPLTDEGYDGVSLIDDVLERKTHRTGMLLNSEELLSLVRLPSPTISARKLHLEHKKTRSAPSSVRGHSHLLGENIHREDIANVSLETRQRLNHLHVIGATGTGKSTLLQNLIVQDIEEGQGVAVIDPHGDLIDRVLVHIPRRRFRDVILFDPSDPENPHGVNILSATSEAEKNVASSDLVSVFQRTSTSWGDQMTVVLGNAIQAFLESEKGGTLLDLRRFLLEDDFRREFLSRVKDQDVQYFWEKQYPMLRGNTIGSLLMRLDAFLRPKIIRRVVAPRTEILFGEILNRQKILLIKLAQGLIGEENSTLLGTIIVSKLHQGAMARQSLRVEQRSPFFLYIDEFQNFITPSLAGVLSGTRKYGLGLVLAHQELRQIFNQDTGVANSLISNPGTRICFRLGDADAQKLVDGFEHFKSQDLQKLGLGEAIVRVESSKDDFNLKVFPPKTVSPFTAKSRTKKLIELSHFGGELASTDVGSDIDDEEIDAVSSVQRTEFRSRGEGSIQDIAEEPVSRRSLTVADRPSPAGQPEENAITQHRYLQTLVKWMAEQRGFRAVIEEPTPDGSGRVDVGLRRGDQRYAVEISVTTGGEQELHNVKKCLTAGYDRVFVCAIDDRSTAALKEFVAAKLLPDEIAKVGFYDVKNDLFEFLDSVGCPTGGETQSVRGYRVRLEHQPMSSMEREKKKEDVARILTKSLRRIKTQK